MNSTSKISRMQVASRSDAPAAAVLVLLLAIGMSAGEAYGADAEAKNERCSAAQGQQYINSGDYNRAIREFTCLVDRQPAEVEGYRGRIEALLLLDRYADAVRDYARITAFVSPVHPDVEDIIRKGYAARLAADANNIPALTGASAARWWYFDYEQALNLLKRLHNLAPNSLFANTFRGSSRLLSDTNTAEGVVDLERAILIAPANPQLRFIVADAYTYGLSKPIRAYAEARLALHWGVDTPRIHAILAVAYQAFGNQSAAAAEIKTHLDQVTTRLLPAPALKANSAMSLALVPGRTYEIPVVVSAGQTLSITTTSPDFWDTILVLLAPGGTPVVGSDDEVDYFAGLNWVAGAAGTYRLRVTSFESVNTGELVVSRK